MRDQKTKRVADQAQKDSGSTASPTYVSVTVTDLDGSRLVASSAGSVLESVANLASWIAGTADEVTVTNDGDGTVTLSTSLKERAISLLASVSINGQTLTKQTIYTVPAGKTMVPLAVCLRSPSATLAGLTDLDLGGNANADDWLQQVTLNAFTATTDYGFVLQPEQAAGPPIVPAKKTFYAATTVFGMMINTGSTGVATFKLDLFGHLF
ncbi:MAG: hypothetical protein V1897_13190 [Pseudomonadota bacterium]